MNRAATESRKRGRVMWRRDAAPDGAVALP
jgi:hypothetical protein